MKETRKLPGRSIPPTTRISNSKTIEVEQNDYPRLIVQYAYQN